MFAAIAFPAALFASSIDIAPLENLVRIKDDPLETSVLFNTYEILSEKPSSDPTGDNLTVYLVASKDRASGNVTYGIVINTIYADERWRFYERLNYIGAKGPVEAKIQASERRVSKCYSALDICLYVENFVVALSPIEFLALAKAPDNVAPWHFKIVPKSGREIRHFLMPAEAEALRIVIEKHGAKK